jgi:Lipid-droplet associated hydrolase
VLEVMSIMQEGFVEVNGVPTHIFTYGQWIHDDFPKDLKEIVLMVTGNPGLGGFYTQFCATIHNELDKR